MKNERPIGIFDSGSGGLTVVDKVLKVLPKENIVYFGDTARVPYGNKSKETITRFSKEISKFLLSFKVKLIIVACNTASSLSLNALQSSLSIPVVGVIKPGAEEAVKLSNSKRIGVIGTDSTVSSGTYKKEIKKLYKKAFVEEKSCPLFVPLVETRWLNDEITFSIAKRYLSPMLSNKIDTLILGCTHYPLLKNVLKKVAGKKVRLVDSSMVVAKYVKELLLRKNIAGNSKKPSVRFFVSDEPSKFSDLAGIFLKKKVKAKKVVL